MKRAYKVLSGIAVAGAVAFVAYDHFIRKVNEEGKFGLREDYRELYQKSAKDLSLLKQIK